MDCITPRKDLFLTVCNSNFSILHAGWRHTGVLGSFLCWRVSWGKRQEGSSQQHIWVSRHIRYQLRTHRIFICYHYSHKTVGQRGFKQTLILEMASVLFQWYTCPVLFKCSHLAKISEATLTAPALPPSEVPPTTTRWEQNPSSWFLYCFQHSPKPWNHTVKLCHSLGRINRPGGKKPTQTKKWANEKE